MINIEGQELKLRDGHVVVVEKHDTCIHITVNGQQKQYDYEKGFKSGALTAIDNKLQKQIIDDIAEIEKQKSVDAEIERERKRIELAEKIKAAEKAALDESKFNKGKKNGKIHPYIDERRNSGKPAVFLVCQNDNYAVESRYEYIWAPTHKDKGESEIASHEELEHVKKGDIIIHHFDNTIHAVSVARKDCEEKESIANPLLGKGRFVELSYHFLEVPANTKALKEEKIKYGSMKYGPFEVTGKNKQGLYLAEAADDLAKLFIKQAIAANPKDVVLMEILKQI